MECIQFNQLLQTKQNKTANKSQQALLLSHLVVLLHHALADVQHAHRLERADGHLAALLHQLAGCGVQALRDTRHVALRQKSKKERCWENNTHAGQLTYQKMTWTQEKKVPNSVQKYLQEEEDVVAHDGEVLTGGHAVQHVLEIVFGDLWGGNERKTIPKVKLKG